MSICGMQVAPFNLKDIKVIRDLNPEDMGCLIAVSGMVTRTSSIIPDLWYAQMTALHVELMSQLKVSLMQF